MDHRLTAAQIEAFHTEGFLVATGLFDDAVLTPVADEITAEIDRRARLLLADGRLTSLYEEEGFETRLARISAETDAVARGIWDGALHGPAIFNLLRHGPLLDVAEQLCGPELIASSVYRLRPKIPGHVQSPVPWHQDSGYFEPYCDKALVLTVWLPLVDANEENGCMWVLPRSHKRGVMRHRSRTGKPYLEIPDEALPEIEPLCVPVRRGSALLLTNLTAHASFENRTNRVRWSMDLRYQSAALPTNAEVTRTIDEEAALRAAGAPPACYPPEADFLVRSTLRPREVIETAEGFAQLRSRHQPRPVTNRWTA
ncbi:MAG: phytanoyl-CoA dioxygenase family protein [Armatimonadetes bacterium]|nr:phytanoyl-CoA dioxygenase family protein [Armatimonadota bacterium]MDE2206302.1 phytanoyl-CoA dioxygenase family protein [Armatimonadota bacterium]